MNKHEDSYINKLKYKIGESDLHGRPIELRSYQLDACSKAISQLLENRNIIIDLPTGTGKTLIANMVSFLWLKNNPKSRVLYVVPRRVLVGQHEEHAGWLSPDYHSYGIRNSDMQNVGLYNAKISLHHIYITTPKMFANSVSSFVTAPDIFSEINLVVIDEYDEFMTYDYQKYGIGVRLKKDFQDLFNHFSDDINYMLMSATSPISTIKGGSKDEVIIEYSEFTQRIFNPITIHLSESDYAEYIPTAMVRIVNIEDNSVKAFDQALKNEIFFAFRDYRCETGITLDKDYIFPRLNEIIYKKISEILSSSGEWIVVDKTAKTLCRKLINILNKYNFLFEDMFKNIDWDIQNRRLICEHELHDNDKNPKFADLNVLIDKREKKEYHPFLRSKYEILKKIINHREKEKGVIFTRFIRLTDSLRAEFTNHGIIHVYIDSRITGAKREKLLDDFQKGKPRILIITRGTGKRGLDLPKADYSIFYSPKLSERTVWQELSRIRSNVHKTKDSYFLTYSSSREESKMQELEEQMVISGREYNIKHHTSEDLLNS